MCLNAVSVILLEKLNAFPLLIVHQSIISLETNTEVNNEKIIPMINTMANPLIDLDRK